MPTPEIAQDKKAGSRSAANNDAEHSKVTRVNATAIHYHTQKNFLCQQA
ncbi:hypothetical protein [Fodinicurvata fenggangensis]|nr:hypothetical protein [Fodinicurvata fenggangensis]